MTFLNDFLFKQTDTSRNQFLRLEQETLEERLVLNSVVNVPFDLSNEAPPTELEQPASQSNILVLQTGESDDVASETSPAIISRVHLLVNDSQEVVIDDSFDTLRLGVGDSVRVIGVDFNVHDSFNNVDGVVAAEAYMSKKLDPLGGSSPDYSDGRFSSRSSNPAMATGDFSGGEMEDGWVIENGWDRISVAMIQYFGDQSEHLHTFSVSLEVGTPDFELDPNVVAQFINADIVKGQEFRFTGKIRNNDSGTYNMYTEVDIYYGDSATPEWVGILSGNLGTVEGEFSYPQTDSAFSEFWTPAESGEYILKFYTDPENAWQESDEGNNYIEVRVNVGEPDASDLGNQGNENQTGSETGDQNNESGSETDSGTETGNDSSDTDPGGETNPGGESNNDSDVGDEGSENTTDGESQSENDVALAAKHIYAERNVVTDFDIELDREQFDAVKVTGLHKRGFEFSAGEKLADGSWIISADELEELTFTTRRRMKGNTIQIVGMSNGQETDQSIEIEMKVEHTAEQIQYRRMRNMVRREVMRFAKKNQNADHTMTLKGLPDAFEIRGAEKVGDAWVISPRDFKEMRKVRFKLAKDTDWKAMMAEGFTVDVEIRSVDNESGEVRNTFKKLEVNTESVMKLTERALGRFAKQKDQFFATFGTDAVVLEKIFESNNDSEADSAASEGSLETPEGFEFANNLQNVFAETNSFFENVFNKANSGANNLKSVFDISSLF